MNRPEQSCKDGGASHTPAADGNTCLNCGRYLGSDPSQPTPLQQVTPEDLALDLEADLELTDPAEIQRLLALMPKLILKCEEKVQEAQHELEQRVDILDVEKAKAQLAATENDQLTAAPDRAAWARTRPEVMNAHLWVIQRRADLKIAELTMRKYERYDTNVRKAANIFETLQNAEMARLRHEGRQ